MTLEQFTALTRTRIPTPEEFLSFVNSQRWEIRLKDGRPALRVPDRSDPVAVALARMLAREPYRTNVLKAAGLTGRAPQQAAYRPREWRWRFGQTYIEMPENEWLWQHENRHPVGAWWFRRGDETWKSVPDRPGDSHAQP
jgi:hypothetical protein